MIAGSLPRGLDFLVKLVMRMALLAVVVVAVVLGIYFPPLGFVLIAFILFSSPAYKRLIS